jgi:hypothetical protein
MGKIRASVFLLSLSLVVLDGYGNNSSGSSVPPLQLIQNRLVEAQRAWSIATADFNHDQYLDVAVTTARGIGVDEAEKGLDILLGDGTGHFTQTARYQWSGGADTTGGFYTVVSGNFNGDDHPDLAILNNRANDYQETDPKPQILVLLGEGDGGFTPLDPIELQAYLHMRVFTSERLVVDDFNKDGFEDIAVSTMGDQSTPVYLEVLSGDGTGGFPSSLTFEADDYWAGMHAIAEGDLNEDGGEDLMVAGGTYFSGGYAAYIGDGSGGFSGTFVKTKKSWATGKTITSLALGYLDGDTHLDAVFPGFRNRIGLVFGWGDGTFSSVTWLSESLFADLDIAKWMDVVIEDLDLDGNQDIIIGNAGKAPWEGGGIVECSGSLFVFPGDGEGNFFGVNDGGVMIDLPYDGPGEEFTCYDVDCVDIDGDGDLDIVAGTNAREAVETFLNRIWHDTPEVWMDPDPSLVSAPYTGDFAIMITDAQGLGNIDTGNFHVTLNDVDITDLVTKPRRWNLTHDGRLMQALFPQVSLKEGSSWAIHVEVSDLDGHLGSTDLLYR